MCIHLPAPALSLVHTSLRAKETKIEEKSDSIRRRTGTRVEDRGI